MTRAYQCANVPGPHLGKVGTSASVASAIKRAERPVLIVGSELTNLDWALNLAKKQDIPVVATAHVAGMMRENGVNPDRVLGAIEITNLLKSPEWACDLCGRSVLYGSPDALDTQALCAAHQDDLADKRASAEC